MIYHQTSTERGIALIMSALQQWYHIEIPIMCRQVTVIQWCKPDHFCKSKASAPKTKTTTAKTNQDQNCQKVISKHLETETKKRGQWQRVDMTNFYLRNAMLVWVLDMALCLSQAVCASQVGVVSKRMNELSWFLVWELHLSYPVMKENLDISKLFLKVRTVCSVNAT